jgi:amidase
MCAVASAPASESGRYVKPRPIPVGRGEAGPRKRPQGGLNAAYAHDPADAVTAASQGRRADSYASFLVKDGLRGARIGVLRQLFMVDGADGDVTKLMETALADMKRQGAEIVDAVHVQEIADIPTAKLFCNRFKHDINAYLATRGPQVPVKNLDEILASGKFHPSIEKRMLDAQAEAPPAENPKCKEATENGARLAAGVLKVMDDARLDALVYPSWNNPPRMIGDLNTPHGNNSPRISPPTGFPAVTVPMGFVRGTLPAGLQILGRPWSEGTLIKIASAYEQATRHRRPPASTPPLAN